MSAIQQVMLGANALGPFDYTLKTFDTDDRTSNGFSYTQTAAGSGVSGGTWNSLLTDGNAYIYKSYTAIKTGSSLKANATVRTTSWSGRVSCMFETSRGASTDAVECRLTAGSTTSPYPIRWDVYMNNALVKQVNIASGGIGTEANRTIELIKTSTGFIANLYDSAGTTLIDTHTITTAINYTTATFWNGTTTDRQQSAAYCESKIYY